MQCLEKFSRKWGIKCLNTLSLRLDRFAEAGLYNIIFFYDTSGISQIKDKLLKAVDESKKFVMKSIEEKESKLRPHWYNSLDLPNWQKEQQAMSWDFPKDPLPITASLCKYYILQK